MGRCPAPGDGILAVRRRAFDQTGLAESAGELGEGELRLEPGEGGAKTVVDATAEAEVLVVGTLGDEAAGSTDRARSWLPEASMR
jgi:hypothetical protein